MAGDKEVYVNFAEAHPPTLMNASRLAVATVADNQVDFMHVGEDYFELTQTGALVASSILFTKDAQGWAVPPGNADSTGFEMNNGNQATTTKVKFTVGSAGTPTESFTFKLTFDCPDVSEHDVFAFGFRKLAAQADVVDAAALLTAYEDVAFINVDGADLDTGAAKVKVCTRVAAGAGAATRAYTGATPTALNWADGAEKSLEVRCSDEGVFTFWKDGSTQLVDSNGDAITVTLTAGAVVIPCILSAATGSQASSSPILVSYQVKNL